MDLHTLHQDIESGFRQLRDLDPADRRRYLAWRLALRQVRGKEPQATRQPTTPEGLRQTWEELLAHIEPQVRPGSLDAWIEPLALVSIDGDKLVLQAPDAFHARWVARQFGLPLERAGKALGFTGYRLTTPTMNTV